MEPSISHRRQILSPRAWLRAGQGGTSGQEPSAGRGQGCSGQICCVPGEKGLFYPTSRCRATQPGSGSKSGPREISRSQKIHHACITSSPSDSQDIKVQSVLPSRLIKCRKNSSTRAGNCPPVAVLTAATSLPAIRCSDYRRDIPIRGYGKWSDKTG